MHSPSNAIAVQTGRYWHAATFEGEACGLSLVHASDDVRDSFRAILAGEVRDAAEFSLANFLMQRDRGRLDYEPVAIFPYRAFRHHVLKVPVTSALQSPADLVGRRVAAPDYSMTAAVWTRGIIADEYGDVWSEVEWILPRKQRFPPPAGLRHRFVDIDAETAVLSGEADAVLSPETEDPAFRTLLPNAYQVEADFHRARHIYPINHLLVVHRSTLERAPQVRQGLLQRFEASMTKALAAADQPVERLALDGTGRLHPDDWPRLTIDDVAHGSTERNRRQIEIFCRYLHAQGLVSTVPDAAAIFAEDVI